jgi:hypothetical protein
MNNIFIQKKNQKTKTKKQPLRHLYIFVFLKKTQNKNVIHSD